MFLYSFKPNLKFTKLSKLYLAINFTLEVPFEYLLYFSSDKTPLRSAYSETPSALLCPAIIIMFAVFFFGINNINDSIAKKQKMRY